MQAGLFPPTAASGIQTSKTAPATIIKCTNEIMRSSEKSPNNFKFAYFVLQHCRTQSWAMSVCVLSKCYYMHTDTEREINSHGVTVWFSCLRTNSPLHLGKVCIFLPSPLSKQKKVSRQCSGLATEQVHSQAGHKSLVSLPLLCPGQGHPRIDFHQKTFYATR